MAEVDLSDAEKIYIIHGVQDNCREDGRGCEDYRHIELETGLLSNTTGSARVRLNDAANVIDREHVTCRETIPDVSLTCRANTDILAGVKAELDKPSPDKPNKGRLEFFVDCSANATPVFEGRGGEELAAEIGNILTRTYDCPSCFDLEALCIIPEEQCWVLYVDVLLLECGGNLFDVASVAVKAALYNTRIPKVTVSRDEGLVELEISDDPYDVQRVEVQSAPCIVTVCKIGHSHIVDASLKEEACCLARLTMGVTERGTVTGLRKDGSGSLDPASVEDMMQTGKRVGELLNKSLMESLLEEERQGSKRKPIGFLK